MEFDAGVFNLLGILLSLGVDVEVSQCEGVLLCSDDT